MRNQYAEHLSNSKNEFVKGSYDKAIEECKKALKFKPTMAEAHYHMGDCYMAVGQENRAMQAYENAVKFQPENGNNHMALGSCFFMKKQYKQALEAFAKAEKYGCSKGVEKQLYYYMGLINEKLNNIKGALYCYDKAMDFVLDIINDISGYKSGVHCKEILARQARIYIQLNNWTKAEDSAIRLRMISPEEFETHEFLFQIYLKNRNLTKAEKVLEEAENFFKNDKAALVKIEFAYAGLFFVKADLDTENLRKYYQVAENCLMNVMRIEERTADDGLKVLLLLGDIYKKTGDVESRLKVLEKVMEMEATEKEKYVEGVKADLIEIYGSKNNCEKALEFARELQCSEKELYKCHGYYWEAHILWKQGEKIPDKRKKALKLYEKAIAYYRNCMINRPVDYIALVYRIRANADIGRVEEAKRLYQMLPTIPDSEKRKLKEHIENAR